MKLLSLTLTNFKGVRNFTLDCLGQNVSIYGNNAVGKTTIFDAFSWLLFDKDSQNKKDFEIKTLDENNQAIPGLNHEVEGVLELDGRRLTLKKVFTEKWTKRRGSAKPEFTGHTTDYYIDGVPKPKKEYDSYIAGIADEGIFKLLTSPTYFNDQLHWTERRRILLETCGDLTDEEVIASDKSLAKLPGILQGRKLEDHRKVIAARRSEINKELERIPVRIDEATRALPDLTGIQADKIPLEIAGLKQRKQQKEQERVRIESGGEVADRKRQLAEVEVDLLRLQSEHRAGQDSVVAEKRRMLNGINSKIDTLKRNISWNKRTADEYRAEIKTLEARIESLRNDWYSTNNQQFEYSQDTACPSCGQRLPEEQLTIAREKALASFNTAKAKQLEQVNEQGKNIKAKLEATKQDLAILDKEIPEREQELTQAELEAVNIATKIKSLQDQSIPITDNPTYQQKLQSKANIENIIASLQKGTQEAIEKVNHEIVDLSIAIASMENDAAKAQRSKDGQRRIEELKEQERTLAAEFEKLEGEIYLTEQFIRAKVALLEQKINSRFRHARFKLFAQQVNGGLSEVCETLYRGVPYGSGLNAGHRIIVGMDIIRTLSEHYGFTAPIFVDNAESVTDLPEMKAQVIRLVKPEITDDNRAKYSRLVVEIEGESRELREVV
jgi:DNA repair exonuclease SbcCD ATPase subunit